MNMQGVLQTAPSWWMGMRVLRLASVPEKLPDTLAGEALQRCLQGGLSLELCLMTGETAGRLESALIMRAQGASLYQLQDRLEKYSDMIVQLLKAEGIHAEKTEKHEELMRFFGGAYTSGCAGAGFCAPDRIQAGGYVPGHSTQAVDLGRVADVLAGYKRAFFSLQVMQSGFSQPERVLMEKYRQAFTAQSENAHAQEGEQAYARLIETSKGQAVYAACFVLGSSACVQEMCAQMRVYGQMHYGLPLTSLLRSDYLYKGSGWMQRVSEAYGHAGEVLRRADVRPLLRLSHLMTLDQALKAYTLPHELKSVRGLTVISRAEDHQPLPVQLLQDDGVYLGERAANGEKVYLPLKSLSRHGMFVGKPGSGKTTFALGLLYRVYNREEKVPFLVIEPAKTEYRSLLKVIPEMRVYTPGRSDISPFQINPFLPPEHVTLEEYLPNLDTIFAMAISMTHPLDVIFPQVIRRCYTLHGWRMDSTRSSAGVRIFGMHEFIRSFREYVEKHYSNDPEAKASIENGGVVRLLKLLSDQPLLFDTNHSLDFDELLSKPAVIELDSIADTRQKALIMAIVMTQVMLTIKRRKDSKGKVRNLILIDEAHLLLSGGENQAEGVPDPASAGVKLLQDMTLILRSYGAALLFGDQSPARLTKVILGNVNLKIMLHLDDQQDRAMLANTSLMTQQMIDDMVTLRAGEAYMHCDLLPAPVRVVTPDSERMLGLDKSMTDDTVREHMRSVQPAPFTQCAMCEGCRDGCDMQRRSDASFVVEYLLERGRAGELLKSDQQELRRYLWRDLGTAVEKLHKDSSLKAAMDEQLTGCVRVQMIRKILLSGEWKMSEEDLSTLPKENKKAAEMDALISSLWKDKK